MNDELKDIIYSDLYRYTGNNRRHNKLYLTYVQEMLSSPEFRFISTLRRTQYYYYKTQSDKKDIHFYIASIAFRYFNASLEIGRASCRERV